MSRLCEISLLRKQVRDELSVLETRKSELELLLHNLDAEFEEERKKLRWRDQLRAEDTPHEPWAYDVFEGGGAISEVDGTRSDA